MYKLDTYLKLALCRGGAWSSHSGIQTSWERSLSSLLKCFHPEVTRKLLIWGKKNSQEGTVWAWSQWPYLLSSGHQLRHNWTSCLFWPPHITVVHPPWYLFLWTYKWTTTNLAHAFKSFPPGLGFSQCCLWAQTCVDAQWLIFGCHGGSSFIDELDYSYIIWSLSSLNFCHTHTYFIYYTCMYVHIP